MASRKVLFVGNSFTSRNGLPGLIAELDRGKLPNRFGAKVVVFC
jgi:hypothetical protein